MFHIFIESVSSLCDSCAWNYAWWRYSICVLVSSIFPVLLISSVLLTSEPSSLWHTCSNHSKHFLLKISVAATSPGSRCFHFSRVPHDWSLVPVPTDIHFLVCHIDLHHFLFLDPRNSLIVPGSPLRGPFKDGWHCSRVITGNWS